MNQSNRYHYAACELIMSFLEEHHLLSDKVRNMILGKDIDGLLAWSQSVHVDAVKAPLDVFIAGLQLSTNLQRLQGMVKDLKDRAEHLQAQLNQSKEQTTSELDWINVKNWH